MLATTLVGTNICVVCSANMVKQATVEFGYDKPWHILAATTIMTLFLLAAEIIPKDWFRQYPYHRCMLFAYPLFIAYIILFIPVRIMAAFTSYTTRLFSGKASSENSLMREDFRMLLHESEGAGIIDAEAADILDRSLQFHELKVSDIYLPLNKVDEIPGDMSLFEAVELCRNHKRSRLPVNFIKTENHNWNGIFTLYDALFTIPEKEWKRTPVKECIRPIALISEDADMEDVLLKAKKSGSPMLVVHSKGNKTKHIGIVTSKDVLKVLFG
jgi:CBS domain containing-hemolysin-like protein